MAHLAGHVLALLELLRLKDLPSVAEAVHLPLPDDLVKELDVKECRDPVDESPVHKHVCLLLVNPRTELPRRGIEVLHRPWRVVAAATIESEQPVLLPPLRDVLAADVASGADAVAVRRLEFELDVDAVRVQAQQRIPPLSTFAGALEIEARDHVVFSLGRLVGPRLAALLCHPPLVCPPGWGPVGPGHPSCTLRPLRWLSRS